MKFKSFRTIAAVQAWFQEDGHLFFPLSEDQDQEVLTSVKNNLLNWPNLPDGVDLVWTSEGDLAFRQSGGTEEEVSSGGMAGFGKIVEATYQHADGSERRLWISGGEGEGEHCEQLCTALNALLEPVRIVSDISGGILNGTWSDRPARVLYTSDDSDDALDFDDYYLAPMSENIYRRRHAWWLHDAEMDGDTIDHFHNQLKER